MKMAKNGTDKMMELLIATERVADEILVNKQELVSLDKRRQETREAIREVKKSKENSVWVTVGSILIKMKSKKALEVLTKDQNIINSEINKLNAMQQTLVNKHRDLEHRQPFKGTNLKPLTSQEFSALRANIPYL